MIVKTGVHIKHHEHFDNQTLSLICCIHVYVCVFKEKECEYYQCSQKRTKSMPLYDFKKPPIIQIMSTLATQHY